MLYPRIKELKILYINLVTNNIIYNILYITIIYNILYITFYVYSILSPQAHHPFLLRSLCSDCNLRYVPAGSVDETFRPPLPEEDFTMVHVPSH